MIRVSVQADDFDVNREIHGISARDHSIGAIVSFIGFVRHESQGEPLVSMSLEHYPDMTERELRRVAENAVARWDLQAVTIIHRVGVLLPGAQIVLVLAASKHRQAAFDAGQMLMDFLKTRAPFWKKETRQSGEYWVEARSSDDEAAARWSQG